jgi:hypothetical protein
LPPPRLIDKSKKITGTLEPHQSKLPMLRRPSLNCEGVAGGNSVGMLTVQQYMLAVKLGAVRV